MSEDRDCVYDEKVIDTILSVLSISSRKLSHRHFNSDSRLLQDFFHKNQKEYPEILGNIRFSTTPAGPYSHEISDALEYLKAMGSVYFAAPATFRSPYVFAGSRIAGDISDRLSEEKPRITELSDKFWKELGPQE